MAKLTQTFFWYDLETSGTDPRGDRIMQFGGQRTTLELEPIGEPVNLLIRLSNDILPQPDAILVTGITPQMTIADGITEADFLRLFTADIATKGTIFAGFNSIRFDDEFMRFLHYRNFYDAYSWQWRDGRGRWDLLDGIRMLRALRPDGIIWPSEKGVSTNRLELLAKANGLVHDAAHDALSDVQASIALAKLVRDKQPKLFSYLLKMRDKKLVSELVEHGEPFVYTSGKYDSVYEKTTVAVRLAEASNGQGSLVYDLRYDPSPFLALSPIELAERWRWTRDKKAPSRLPIKTLQYNRCPAVAPLSVLDAASQSRIKIDLSLVAKHRELLREQPHFIQDVLAALKILDDERAQKSRRDVPTDERLYDAFMSDHDTNLMGVIRAADPADLAELSGDFHDERLRQLLPLYKARNFPNSLSTEERVAWETHCYDVLMNGGSQSRLARYMHRLTELLNTSGGRADKRYILEELQLYAESIIPAAD